MHYAANKSMNAERGAWAALAGFCGLFLTLAAVMVRFFTDPTAPGLGTPGVEEQPGPLFYSIVYLAEVTLLIASGVLPALALCASWPRSLLVSGAIGSIIFLPALATVEGAPATLTIILIVGVMLLTLASSIGNVLNLTGIVAVIVTAVVFSTMILWLFSSGNVRAGVLVGPFAWVILPAIAGLFQPAGRDASRSR